MTPPRKGARSRADIPPDILRDLNLGIIPSLSLSEGLAVDFATLFASCFPDTSPAARKAMRDAGNVGYTQRMAIAARLLLKEGGEKIIPQVAAHPSDTVRGWGCYMIAQSDRPSLAAYLAAMRPLAADPHFGVREWAWIALRPHIARDIETAVALLLPWTGEQDAALRRFAIEITRPRGVWCSHIPALRKDPTPAALLLEETRSDASRYVQDSTANWLNDAGKDNPAWVKQICARWQKESRTPATAYITKRALRSVTG